MGYRSVVRGRLVERYGEPRPQPDEGGSATDLG
jgi:hypothetical protein